MIFQSANGLVTCVRTASEQLAPPDVIELDDLFPVAGQCLGRADVLDAVFVPQSGPASRKVDRPLSALTPAPVKTTIFFTDSFMA